MTLQWAVLSGLCLLTCLACFYLVADYHYRRGEKVLAVLLVVFAPFGVLFAYVYGWLHWRDKYLRAVMVVWTLSLCCLVQLLGRPGTKLGH